MHAAFTSQGPTSNDKDIRSALLPARLNAEQTAAVLGFQPHDISTLVAAGLLTPLGRSQKGKNTVKYFAMVEVLDRRSDPKWLSRATDAAYQRFARTRQAPEENAGRSLSAGQRPYRPGRMSTIAPSSCQQ